MGKASSIGVSGAKLLGVFTLTKSTWDRILYRLLLPLIWRWLPVDLRGSIFDCIPVIVRRVVVFSLRV